MFAVLYKWTLKKGSEAKFVDAWEEVTAELSTRWETQGSRLHRTQEGDWIAYAQWPSREKWEEASQATFVKSAARVEMAAAVESGEILMSMDIVKDLLTGPRT